MRVQLNEVNGIADAIVALHMSKRTWTPELDKHIREVVRQHTQSDSLIEVVSASEEFNSYMQKLTKWGPKHPTLLRFIDLSVMVEGLHRGGQDDWDSHAKRFDNRIIRSSTRLADFHFGEKSDYYKDHILTTDEVCAMRGVELPGSVIVDGKLFVRAVNGYVDADYENSRDMRRGLYMLSIPSNFIFRCNLTEFAHVYKERNANSTAHPEVQQVAEAIATQLEEIYPQFNRELLLSIRN